MREFEMAVDILPPDNEVNAIALKENLSYENAEKKWHRDVHRVLYNKVVEETRCICTFFQRLFPKIQFGDFWKIEIVLTNRLAYKEIIIGEVCEIRIFFDYKELMSLDDYDKKEKTLELLMNGLKIFSDKFDYPYREFDTIAEIIRKSNYENIWVWQQKKEVKRGRL